MGFFLDGEDVTVEPCLGLVGAALVGAALLGAALLGAALRGVEAVARGGGAAGVASTARFWAGAGARAAFSIQPPAPLFTSWMRR